MQWIVTINEPNVVAVFHEMTRALAYAGGDTASVAMALAGPPPPEFAPRLGAVHAAARRVLRGHTDAKLGWTIACQAFTPTPGNEATFGRMQAWEGDYLDYCDGDDFIGVQSYTSQPVGTDGPVPHPPDPGNTQTGWAFRPDALGINLQRLAHHKQMPLLVTENGVAVKDDGRRVEYIAGALTGLAEAVSAGADVLGYFYWSLLDNYEWGRWDVQFGLAAVERSGTFARLPRPSLELLGKRAQSARRGGS